MYQKRSLKRWHSNGVFPLDSSSDSHSQFNRTVKKLEDRLFREMILSTSLNSKADFSENKQYVLVKWVVRVSSSKVYILSPLNNLFFFPVAQPPENRRAPFLAQIIFNIADYLILFEDSPPPAGFFLARDMLRFDLALVGHRVLIFPQLSVNSVFTGYWYFH